MAVEYSIRDGVLTLEMIGVYEPQDVMKAFLEAMDDPACPRPVAFVVDVSRSESLATRPAEEIRKMAAALGPYADRIGRRVAAVAPSDVHYGLSRIGAARSESVGVAARVFRTHAEALKWLRDPTTSRR